MPFAMMAFFIFIFPSSNALSCIIDPASDVRANPVEYFDKASAVFRGRISSFIDISEDVQIVEFIPDSVYKGSVPAPVIVHNKLDTSCSRLLIMKGASYYVFMLLSNEGYFEIPGFASFVLVSEAPELHLEFAQGK